jgi:drug/metabolite transporter (DMT)-like permease
MNALTLGLVAAFAWAIHDIIVRQVSQKTPLMAALLAVLIFGALFHLGVMTATDAFRPIGGAAAVYAMIAGVFFVIASVGLYHAFQRGPVRLVSPIIASYPVLSVAWAVLSGASVSPLQWAAVLAIAIGVSLVAALADDSADTVPPKGPTILWAASSAIGFAGTFGFGQQAAELAGEMPSTLVTRAVAIVLLMVIISAKGLPWWPGRAALPVLALMGVMDGIALMAVLSAGGMADAQYASVTSSMFGLLTILLAWLFLREPMTIAQWLGCGIAFIGIGTLAL